METFFYDSQFNRMKKDVAESLRQMLAVETVRRRIHVNDVWVDDNLDSSDFESQKKAVKSDRTWGVPVYASLDLYDKTTGKKLSSAKKIRVATLPKDTRMGSFIVNGKHYQVSNQLRRKPGVYVLERENKEFEAQFSVPGKQFSVRMDDKQRFMVHIGQSDQPLYPLLSRMGVSDGALAKAWGEDVLHANKAVKAKRGDSSIKQIAKKLTGEDYESADIAASDLRDHLEKVEVSADVTQQTLGKAYKNVSTGLLVHASKDLMRVQRGDREPDEAQSIEFKTVMSVADFVKERLDTHSQKFRSRIIGRMSGRSASQGPPDDIREVISSNEVTPIFESFFTQTDLSSTPDQINPIHMLNGLSSVTIRGEGGIKSEHGIKESERALHPSHLGFIDPIHTPDSGKIGTTMHLAAGAQKTDGNELATVAIDPRGGPGKYLTPATVRKHVVALPDQWDREKKKFIGKKVQAMVNGSVSMVNAKDVDYVIADPKQAFSFAANTIPFLPSTQGNRSQMSAKMTEQALPLAEREAPLVQTKIGRGTWEGMIGDGFSLKSKEDGVVTSVTSKAIKVQHGGGVSTYKLADNYPLNQKSFIHQESSVKEGDKVKAGEVLADSNFTRDGKLAIGTNLRAAYIPYKGYNFEDGIVITESAAKKLTSEHMYQYGEKLSGDAEFSLNSYMGWKAGDLTIDQQGKLDKEGIVRKGQIVERGDPLWVGVRENILDPESIVMSRYTKMQPKRAFKKEWDHDYKGKVIDVVRTGNNVKLYIKTMEPAQIGDKLSNREAAKGIITKVIPDGEAPKTADGEPVEILLNPHGIVSRINPSQMLETAASKVAEKTGKPYVVDNFSGENYVKSVSAALKKAGITDTEELFDANGKLLGNVMVGKQYTLKLAKQATSQFSARATGRYDTDRSPSKGGDDGAKALDLLTMYSMLAHGSRANLREMATYKGSQNQEFWHWLEAGSKFGRLQPPPEPTFAYRKFEAYLKGAGVDVKRKGSEMVLAPMTTKEVEKISAGAVKEPLFLRAKDLQKIKGGLFDPIIHGADEDNWSHYNLSEPVPNPVFEDPIKKLTGLTDQQFTDLTFGKSYYDPKTGEFNTDRLGLTGGHAIKRLLKDVNLDEIEKEWTEKISKTRSPTKRNEGNKILRYTRALKENKLKPADAYVLEKLPILPPKYRPVYPLPNGDLGYSQVNNLYRDVGLINNELKWQNSMAFIPDSARQELRENLYEGVKALTGIKGSKPIAFYQPQRRPKGFISEIKGDPAKTGFYQNKVLRRTQELVGRGTIIPEPKLGVDEVGLPETMAWEIFRPFVVRDLVGSGMDPNDAVTAVEDKSPTARAALDAVMHERPVMLNRAPSLHKFSIMAFKPKITDGKAIKIPPLIVKGFNADFDGDTMTVHVPILDDAVEEAKKMFPSKNLYNPGTGEMVITPMNEAALGLYQLSKTPEGRKQIDGALPKGMQDQYGVLDKKGLKGLISGLAKDTPQGYGKAVDSLKAMGDKHTYDTGFTVGLKDLMPAIHGEKRVTSDLTAALGKLDTSKRSQRDKAILLIRDADMELQKSMKTSLRGQDNNFFQMVDSGARGNMGQLKQIVSSPMLVDDHQGNPSPIPIMSSYANGLGFSDYWSALYGARRVAMDKQLQTQKPGAFAKDIMASAVSTVISGSDCGTKRGIKMDIGSRDVEDRFTSGDIKVGNTVIASAGTAVTSSLLSTLRDRGVKEIGIRSPITCSQPKGLCAKCYGLDDEGNEPVIGENVGAISATALSEPLTQMTLRTFHSGGLSGSRTAISGYDKVDKLLKLHQVRAGKAVLAQKGGTIEKKERAPGGVGVNLWIGGDKHYVPAGARLEYKVGATVKKGDKLTDGLIQPQELAELKGMIPAQEYIVDEVQKSYLAEGVNLKRRAVETVVRSFGNVSRVIDPGDSLMIPHDIMPYTMAEDFNNKSLGSLSLKKALGKVLREDVGELKQGTKIDDAVAKALRGLGRTEVKVSPSPIIHKPVLTGITRIPLMSDDWMAQMGYQELEDSIVTGARKGSKSNLHSYHPVPAFAYGAEFGDEFLGAKDGKY